MVGDGVPSKVVILLLQFLLLSQTETNQHTWCAYACACWFVCFLVSTPLGDIDWSVIFAFPGHLHLFSTHKHT